MASLTLKTLAVIQLCFLFAYADLFDSLQIRRFNCGNGQLIVQRFVCDGDNDCGNGADERNCGNEDRSSVTPSVPSQDRDSGISHIVITRRRLWSEMFERFDCGNGQSVPQSFLCDGDNDCRNGADERNCTNDGESVSRSTASPIVPNQDRFFQLPDPNTGLGLSPESSTGFDCGNGNTVLQAFVCDGDDDCRNGADERNCSRDSGTSANRANRIVMGIFFECGNNRYVRLRSLCDGNDDCGNLADESNCNQDTGITLRRPSRGEVTDVFLKEDASIQSPDFPQDYPNNLNIIWNISTVPGHRIKVAFIVKELEDSRDCSADRLSFYDGHDLSSPPLGVYCRHHEQNLPDPTVSSSNAMVVQFASDSTVSWQGFHLALSTVCGGTLNARPSENELLSHPKFGDDVYGEDDSCDWIIKSRPERNVLLSFTNFDVGTGVWSSDTEKLNEKVEVSGCENSITGNCVQYIADEENDGKDFVEIYDGPDDSSRRLGKYSGDQAPLITLSRGEELLIRFRSGGTGSFRGFRAVYKEV